MDIDEVMYSLINKATNKATELKNKTMQFYQSIKKKPQGNARPSKRSKQLRSLYTKGTTPVFNAKTLFNTINPFSPFVKGSRDWVPQTAIKLLRSNTNKQWNKEKNPAKVAHVLFKILLGSSTFGLGTMGLRALMYGTDKKDYKVSKTPTGDINKLYTRPVTAPLSLPQTKQNKGKQKQDKDITKKADFAYPIALSSLPLAASVIAAGIGAKKADKFFDSLKIKKLKKQQQQLLAEKQRIAIQRIKKARGIQDSTETMQKVESLKKKALVNTLISGAGLLAMITFLLGRQAGKAFHDSTNKQTVQFKAYQKGLQEYNKARAFQQGIQTQPLDPQMVRLLNSNLNNKPKALPVNNNSSLNEIMI